MASLGMFLRSVLEDVRAWRRGERRIAPRYTRGRIYKKIRAEERPKSGSGGIVASTEPIGTLSIKVTRADGRVEHHEVPLSAESVQ